MYAVLARASKAITGGAVRVPFQGKYFRLFPLRARINLWLLSIYVCWLRARASCTALVYLEIYIFGARRMCSFTRVSLATREWGDRQIVAVVRFSKLLGAGFYFWINDVFSRI